jgi:hypothetical protein
VPTASGFGRHRTVHPPEASAALAAVFAAIEGAGATPVAHCCAPDVPVELLRGAGARGISLDATLLTASSYDAVAEVVEAGEWALLGAVPSLAPADPQDDRGPTELVQRLLETLGLAPYERLVVTPSCGLAGADRAWGRRALQQARAAARRLDERDEREEDA